MMMPSCMYIDVEEDKKKSISFFSEMDWNAKWDWDNLAAFNSKASESVKMLQLTDWGIDDDGEIDTGSFDLSGIGGSSGGSGSDFGTGSLVKSSKSASTDSSSKEGMTTSSFAFQALEGSPSAIIEKPVPASSDLSRTSSPLEASVISVEPLMGLKLGKRTYFENNCPGSSIKSPAFTVVPVASSAAAKKAKSSSQNGAISRCQVEGCNLDLSSSNDYHRKHKVCDIHSKCPRVTIAGVERRFCQQCSRFHSLAEFDAKKRSCRRRLADHNARRRKPRQDTIKLNSTKLSSSFYDGGQNMNFSLSNVGCAGNSKWESLCDSKFTLTKHIPLKPDKVGNPPLVGFGLPSSIAIFGNSSNELLTSKRTTGFKESIFSSNLDAAPDLPRAFSLLSTNACGLSEPGCISLDQPLHASPPTCSPPTVIPHGLPLASSENWQIEQHSSSPHLNSFAAFASGNTGGLFPAIQLFKPQYQNDIY